MQPPGGDLFYLSGEFREVDPPARLAYTFRWDPPDPDDRQTVVKLSLQDRGEPTEVLLAQRRTPDCLGSGAKGVVALAGRQRQHTLCVSGEKQVAPHTVEP
jgi:uncharacterized protein YndB with AHSA1/START domain